MPARNNARRRELIAQNRLLVRQEGLAERDVAALIRRMAGVIADRLTYGAIEPSLQIVDDHRPELEAVLKKRLLQMALIFGDRTLARLDSVAKSAGPMEHKNARERFEAVIVQWVSLHALDAANSITRTLKEAVRSVLQESFQDGTGEAGTAKLIREKVGRKLSASNAARIARTEMHTASTIGADEAARSTGLEMVKEWASAEDGRTRPSHAQADGKEVGIDESFDVGGEALMVPGDPGGSPENIINCRCTTLYHPVIGGQIIR